MIDLLQRMDMSREAASLSECLNSRWPVLTKVN
jgi:hypothetical protein